MDSTMDGIGMENKNIKVLMVGVDSKRKGGMWSVAELYINNMEYNSKVDLTYVATSTQGSLSCRIKIMLKGILATFICLLKERIDIVHVHMAEKGSVYRKGLVIKLAKIFKKKVVIQLHAGPFMYWYNSLNTFNKAIVGDILNAADCVAVLGEYWRAQLKEILPEEKIRVLYNGTECTNKNRYNPDGKYILFLGMITEKKGAFDLINAISICNNTSIDNLKILMCGFDYEKRAQKYTEELGIDDHFVFTGWIDKDQKEEIFSNTMLTILPSYFEGLSMTVIESIAHGIPVITTNISTMFEILGDDTNLIQPGDVDKLVMAIDKYVDDRDYRIMNSKAVFQRAVKHFSIEENVENTLRIYRKVLNLS